MHRGRPKKTRIIEKAPKIQQFSPRGRHGRPGHVELDIDQYEAIRLADFKGLSQKQASGTMGISQQTFSRVLKAARKRLAEGIVTGSIINIKPHKETPENPRGSSRQPA